MHTLNGMPIRYVDTPQALAEAVEACASRSVIALDTEFMRVRTFYACAALFQLCDGETCFLIDPLAVQDLTPLATLLAAPGVLKLMHSCSEDLEVCDRRFGVLPEPLLDTQVMAAFCGHGLSIGYQRILSAELGLDLEKSETRTDWLQRPLTEAQVHYAAEDVANLPALYRTLSARLESDPQRAAWVREECAGILRRFRARDGVLDYRGIGGAWRLDPRGLAVLRGLHAWRERTARERDLPRSWVVPDGALLRIADLRPSREEQLGAVEDLPPPGRRRFGKALLEQVTGALALPDEELPERVEEPGGPAEGRRVKGLRALVVERGEALGIAPEMLARRRELEEIVRCAASGADPLSIGVLQGWRREVIGEELWKHARGGQ